MMRALWTAGSGMRAQQLNVDIISNNMANANTTGYKKEKAEFKDLLYETIDRAYMLSNGGVPVNVQVGHGAAVSATMKNYSGGNLEKTDSPLDFAIDGDGFFTVMGPSGNVVFTRDGSFKVSVKDQENTLTTSDGYPILDDQGNAIVLNIDISKLNVSPTGEISYIDKDGKTIDQGQRLGVVKFYNRAALESIGSNFYTQNSATGIPIPDGELGVRSNIQQGFVESSNVQVVEEMVKLIIAQRAYELNSKAVQSSDEMLGMANNLKR